VCISVYDWYSEKESLYEGDRDAVHQQFAAWPASHAAAARPAYPAGMGARTILGTVVAPSGTLLVIDAGYLGFWCHDREPRVPQGAFRDDDAEARANASVDVALDGPGAEAVGRALGRQWHPRYLFDIPRDAIAALEDDLKRQARALGVEARAVVLPKRVTHLRRVGLALTHGGGAGEVQVSGLWNAVVGDVPRDRPLTMWAEPMDDPQFVGRWRWVGVDCRPEVPVARTEAVGHTMVDQARLLVADVAALADWSHEEPLDGRADVVLWGRDAERTAAIVGAPRLDGGEWGWRDLPVDDAHARARRLFALKEREGLLLGLDFRPHSHHYLARCAVSMVERLRSSNILRRACGCLHSLLHRRSSVTFSSRPSLCGLTIT
jgi:hypothetical protein